MMHTREAFTLRAYNSLHLNRSGHLELSSITGATRSVPRASRPVTHPTSLTDETSHFSPRNKPLPHQSTHSLPEPTHPTHHPTQPTHSQPP